MKYYCVTSILISILIVCNVSAHECDFRYSKKFISNTIIPILKNKYGNEYKFFNLDSPRIVNKGNTIELIFDGIKPSQKILPLDGPVYFILVDSATCHVISSYEAPAYSY